MYFGIWNTLCHCQCPTPNTTVVFIRRFAAAKPGALGGGLSALGGKKKIGKGGPVLEKKVIPAETDPEKLVNYVCGSNIMKEGDPVKLKADNEYPEWLWNLRTTERPPITEIEYDTPQYWSRVIQAGRRQLNQLRKNRRF